MGEPLSPALAIAAERYAPAAGERAEGVPTVARGQRQQWIGSYRAAEALERVCIPGATFDLLVREGISPFKRVGARWQGTSYPMPAIEALAVVLDRFVKLSWRNYDRWWTAVSGRGLGEAPDCADTLCFFHDPVVRAEWDAAGEAPVDDDWVFERLLSDLRHSEEMTDLIGTTTPAEGAEGAEAAGSTADTQQAERTEQMDAPGIDWDAWVRRLRLALEVAPTGGAWGYTGGELRERRAILRGDLGVASHHVAHSQGNRFPANGA